MSKIEVYNPPPYEWELYLSPGLAIRLHKAPNKKHREAQEKMFGFKWVKLEQPRKCR